MNMYLPAQNFAGQQFSPATLGQGYNPNARWGSNADFFGLNRAGPQSQQVYNQYQAIGQQNYNNLIGTGLNAAFGGAPRGPIQNLSTRLAAELYGGGDINGASLLPNTNLQPWHRMYFGGIGGPAWQQATNQPPGMGNFSSFNNNPFNSGFNTGFNGYNPNQPSASWPAQFQSQNYVNPLQLNMGQHANPFFNTGGIPYGGGTLDYNAYLALGVANQAYNPYAMG